MLHLTKVLDDHKKIAKKPYSAEVRKKILATQFQLEDYRVDRHEMIGQQVRPTVNS